MLRQLLRGGCETPFNSLFKRLYHYDFWWLWHPSVLLSSHQRLRIIGCSKSVLSIVPPTWQRRHTWVQFRKGSTWIENLLLSYEFRSWWSFSFVECSEVVWFVYGGVAGDSKSVQASSWTQWVVDLVLMLRRGLVIEGVRGNGICVKLAWPRKKKGKWQGERERRVCEILRHMMEFIQGSKLVLAMAVHQSLQM